MQKEPVPITSLVTYLIILCFARLRLKSLRRKRMVAPVLAVGIVVVFTMGRNKISGSF